MKSLPTAPSCCRPTGGSRAPHRFLPLIVFFLGSSCHTLEFYEKGALSDPAMQFTESSAQLHWQQKVQFSDEGAAGGLGTSAGGGCGCY